MTAAVTSKIEDGNIKAAIRIICSEDKPALDNKDTFTKLTDKHPKAAHVKKSIPAPETLPALQVTEAEVLKAIKSFPPGSAGGPDGLRPQHILDLVQCTESGAQLLSSITAFTNILLDGKCHAAVVPILFGGNLIALEKKTGGIRPIAIGYTWRRIAAKCANSYVISRLRSYFSPLQLGVATSGGCEAAVHATRRFLETTSPDDIVVKLDFSNAFNSLHRDAMLTVTADMIPEIYRFSHLSYANPSQLKFGSRSISSEVGAQQGDPLGPLLFCLTIQPILAALTSPLKIGYLDDITIGGQQSTVAEDVDTIRTMSETIGLKLNNSKCELISNSKAPVINTFKDFVQLQPDSAYLLGAPLTTGPAMDQALQQRSSDLERGIENLKKLAAHDALVLLRHSFSAPKLLHTLRSSPCVDHPLLQDFDRLIKNGLGQITNSSISDIQFIQASLPVKDGGLGIRRVTSLAPSAFLASAAGTLNLQEQILAQSTSLNDKHVERIRSNWTTTHNQPCPPVNVAFKQAAWDKPVVLADKELLFANAQDNHSKARLLAASSPHSGDWLNAMPISSCGLRLDDEAIRVSVGLRLGLNLCEPHPCPCGSIVDARGIHGLSCRRSSGRMSRHHSINDLIWRSLNRAQIPSSKEPTGLSRTDGKRPDGLSLIPWQAGKSLIWDVTVADTLATSHLPTTSSLAGAAAESAALKKMDKYRELSNSYIFVPISFETMGPISKQAINFLKELGKRISAVTRDEREGAFLFQRLSITLQRFNNVCFRGSFITPEDYSS